VIHGILEVDSLRSKDGFPVSSRRREIDLGVEIASAG